MYAISGGTGAHMADLCAAAGLQLPELEPATQKKLREWIPGYFSSQGVDFPPVPSVQADPVAAWETVQGAVAKALADMRERYRAAAAALPTQEDFLRAAGAWAASDVRPQPMAVR